MGSSAARAGRRVGCRTGLRDKRRAVVECAVDLIGGGVVGVAVEWVVARRGQAGEWAAGLGIRLVADAVGGRLPGGIVEGRQGPAEAEGTVRGHEDAGGGGARSEERRVG